MVSSTSARPSPGTREPAYSSLSVCPVAWRGVSALVQYAPLSSTAWVKTISAGSCPACSVLTLVCRSSARS